MSEWQDISTAPQDGSYVLLSNENGAWIGRYMDRYQSGFRPSQPWRSMMLNHWHMPEFCSLTPTHWMALPKPHSSASVQSSEEQAA